MRLRVNYDRLGIRLGKLIITLDTWKSRHNLLEVYDAIIKSLHNSETLVKYPNTGFGLGTCQGKPPSPKGLCGTFKLPRRELPKSTTTCVHICLIFHKRFYEQSKSLIIGHFILNLLSTYNIWKWLWQHASWKLEWWAFWILNTKPLHAWCIMRLPWCWTLLLVVL